MSSDKRENLQRELGAEIRALQTAVDSFDAAAAESMGINRTDLHCLDVLMQRESAAPSELGAALGLTTGSVTALLDRLDRLGYVTRSPDPKDRRKSVVRPTPEAVRAVDELFGPLAHDGFRQVAGYTTEQLSLLLDFMRSSRELQERHLRRIRP
ncbi:MarR family transcriptional regulator [Streptomyces lunaelactis]|uniref:MarR family transcriptional regulator n=1 Tax=Streptomyces lunaelactis TaxID=1535768 RepID=A0A2R4TBE4_9ACTN|nr:MarR family transcriptional regulator [Streptomyces lunaelactis]AVZ76414.1 MarR family transcriptional regulator [Streptomyces lunaelactis]NUK00676.1 MarR family transcriptional regulator [Streptomyces lunaelactis]NUK06602.1 MarR family transcriptional regulator [Streptomyces lunaelactis]NUK14396.1 MarR family transcriptional regulator [Streptomyces lunaelactis]NUK21439.1 MarR family transcriptional regulator [Streptomyces lunaelactis]